MAKPGQRAAFSDYFRFNLGYLLSLLLLLSPSKRLPPANYMAHLKRHFKEIQIHTVCTLAHAAHPPKLCSSSSLWSEHVLQMAIGKKALQRLPGEISIKAPTRLRSGHRPSSTPSAQSQLLVTCLPPPVLRRASSAQFLSIWTRRMPSISAAFMAAQSSKAWPACSSYTERKGGR